MCEESKIPIILTCTNYSYVKQMLNIGTNVCTSESLHFVRPTTSRFSRHLKVFNFLYFIKKIKNLRKNNVFYMLLLIL